ncbi:binding partner of ACD11 1 isoform X2 [Cucumis melo var. makuwa]|uniref:Binding partner of ACD11 1 isoform X2 n=3 Tax=Cucumis melo TaxID=3656 RepID=A0A5A7UH68_CUCMM|nr:binding partner of ACD11 1 isoform X2 [Cucumis melo var. makuwa]TYK11480.1 binding partner of ACD11 1 isoform X2 [Cucumis melo var. makuwa]
MEIPTVPLAPFRINAGSFTRLIARVVHVYSFNFPAIVGRFLLRSGDFIFLISSDVGPGASLSRLQLLLVDFRCFLAAAMKHFLIEVLVLFCMQIKTVKVSNVSLGASERDIKEFFSFSGDIEYLEMQSETERSQTAYVTFKDAQGAETAVLLSGATIVDLSVNITLCPDYELPPEATAPPPAPGTKPPGAAESAFRKAEDVVSGMLAKGFILGKDALNSAKAFDEKHQLTSTASAKVATLDKKIGFTEKISAGTSLVSDKVREVDQKFQVSEKTKSAFAVAEEKVSNAGSAIMKNRYVMSGTSWVADTFNKVAKAAGEVGQKTKEKVVVTEEEQKKKTVEDFAKVHLSESPKAASAPPEEPQQRPKPEPAQGLIL